MGLLHICYQLRTLQFKLAHLWKSSVHDQLKCCFVLLLGYRRVAIGNFEDVGQMQG